MFLIGSTWLKPESSHNGHRSAPNLRRKTGAATTVSMENGRLRPSAPIRMVEKLSHFERVARSKRPVRVKDYGSARRRLSS